MCPFRTRACGTRYHFARHVGIIVGEGIAPPILCLGTSLWLSVQPHFAVALRSRKEPWAPSFGMVILPKPYPWLIFLFCSRVYGGRIPFEEEWMRHQSWAYISYSWHWGTQAESARELGAEEGIWDQEGRGNGSGEDYVTRSFMLWSPHQILFG